MDAALRNAQKDLDKLLRSIPDELTRIYSDIDCEELLKQLAETTEPSPNWLAAKARSLRLKSRLQGAAVGELASRLCAALEAYRAAGGDDSLRLAHAETDGAMLAARQEAFAQRQQDADQLVRAAMLAEQQEDTVALLCSPLLQKLRLEGTDGT
ncbi:MAG: hypothetical protein IIY70_02520 [Oscillospiraceae bacterium]|nr:hypothetical protein [Oscillospiraceae bacterium]